MTKNKTIYHVQDKWTYLGLLSERDKHVIFGHGMITVKFLDFQTPANFPVNILILKLKGSTIV